MEKNPTKLDQPNIKNVVTMSRDWDYWVDPDGVITHVSPSCETITGYRASEILQRPELVTRIIHPEDLSSVTKHFRSVELGETGGIHFRIITAFKTVRWMSRSCQRVFSDTGTHAGIRVINRDITFQKNLEQELQARNEQLERSNRELEHFAYAAAHDLREPLVAVAAELKSMERRLRTSQNLSIQKSLSKAMNLILAMDSMLQSFFSRSGVSPTPSFLDVSDANICLKDAMSNLDFSLKKSGATVTSDKLPLVNIDAPQLTRIFRNLIANSIKFRTSSPLRIHIGCASCGPLNQFHVSDNGMGMEPPYLERVFKLLERMHDPSGPSGSGIGLFVCRKIIEQHGGNLWLDSTPQEGSSFYFTLPAVSMETSEQTFRM